MKQAIDRGKALRAIWARAHSLGLNEETLHTVIKERFNISSIAACNYQELNMLMSYLGLEWAIMDREPKMIWTIYKEAERLGIDRDFLQGIITKRFKSNSIYNMPQKHLFGLFSVLAHYKKKE